MQIQHSHENCHYKAFWAHSGFKLWIGVMVLRDIKIRKFLLYCPFRNGFDAISLWETRFSCSTSDFIVFSGVEVFQFCIIENSNNKVPLFISQFNLWSTLDLVWVIVFEQSTHILAHHPRMPTYRTLRYSFCYHDLDRSALYISWRREVNEYRSHPPLYPSTRGND